MKRILVSCLSLLALNAGAQSLIMAEPVQGHSDDTSTLLQVELHGSVQQLDVYYAENGTMEAHKDTYTYPAFPKLDFRPIVIRLSGIDPNRSYRFTLQATAGDKTEEKKGYLYERKPSYEFSFLTGSCAYLDNNLWDPNGVHYKADTSIFYRMSEDDADFMLWLGDNWYLGEHEYHIAKGLANKAHYTRLAPPMQRLQRVIPHYAIWDDHDYGYNDAGADYELKRAARKNFMDYWPNPYYGENNQGIYTHFLYKGVAFFMLDDRTWRASDKLWDEKWGKPNPEKVMFGKKQMRWLKKMLLENKDAPFKIIANGSQVVNPLAGGDCLAHFPVEYKELLDFIKDNKIKGVVFLSGDRHFSCVNKLEREGHYPLYDITISPFTSDIDKLTIKERNSSYLVPGTLVEQYNYGYIGILGNSDADRRLQLEIVNTKGKTVARFEVAASELVDPE